MIRIIRQMHGASRDLYEQQGPVRWCLAWALLLVVAGGLWVVERLPWRRGRVSPPSPPLSSP